MQQQREFWAFSNLLSRDLSRCKSLIEVAKDLLGFGSTNLAPARSELAEDVLKIGACKWLGLSSVKFFIIGVLAWLSLKTLPTLKSGSWMLVISKIISAIFFSMLFTELAFISELLACMVSFSIKNDSSLFLILLNFIKELKTNPIYV